MRLIVTTFLFMGWGFYELSGGSDFVPEERPLAEAVKPAAIETQSIAASSAVEDTQIAAVVEEPATIEPEEPSQVVPASLIVVQDDPVVEEPALEPASEVQEVADVAPELLDIRLVNKPRVNVRSGPGTDYDIAARLVAGDETQIIEDLGNGWVQVKIADGNIGWMADFLLTPKVN